MLYGPDDKPIIPEYAKGLRTLTEAVYKKSLLKSLEKKFCFTDWWGPTLYDARGNRIEWPGRPMVPVKTGRTIQFFRKMEPMDVAGEAAEALGYRAGETRDVPIPEGGVTK
jgi:hypothetical protein